MAPIACQLFEKPRPIVTTGRQFVPLPIGQSHSLPQRSTAVLSQNLGPHRRRPS